MRQKSKAKGKRILGVVLALVFLISCITVSYTHLTLPTKLEV